jgi:lambda family phage minor tail protein L
MTNITSLQSLANDSEILLFEMSNFNKASPYDTFYFTANDSVLFGAVSYIPLACSIDGLEMTNTGQLPTPTLSVSDATTEDSLIISGLVDFYGGLEGSWITIRQVLRMNLDDGIAPNPAATKPVQKFQISHIKEMIPGVGVNFELTTPLELLETKLPTQLCLTRCPWRYRYLLECPFAGNFDFDINGNPVPVGSPQAACGKTLKDCELRFGSSASGAVLPTGAFPSLTRIG